jgi:hypothetical protein
LSGPPVVGCVAFRTSPSTADPIDLDRVTLDSAADDHPEIVFVRNQQIGFNIVPRSVGCTIQKLSLEGCVGEGVAADQLFCIFFKGITFRFPGQYSFWPLYLLSPFGDWLDFELP